MTEPEIGSLLWRMGKSSVGLARLAIDPNVRVRDNQTFCGFEDATRVPEVGEAVEVWEAETGVVGDGKVIELDDLRQLIFIKVDWPSLNSDRIVRLDRELKGAWALLRAAWMERDILGQGLVEALGALGEDVSWPWPGTRVSSKEERMEVLRALRRVVVRAE